MNQKQKVTEILNKFALVKKSSKTKQKRFDYFLSLLGDPQTRYQTIHIAGTSGKGSTVTFLSSILHSGGSKVGLTLSPHVQKVTERIQLNNQPLEWEVFYKYLVEVLPLTKLVADKVGPLSYFELLTGLGFYIFAREKVDIGVIESGIGGSRDVTNVLDPELAIITNVDLDHTSVLGKTVEEIALDKAGIIKSSKPVFSSATQKSVVQMFMNKARQQGSPLYLLGKDINISDIKLGQSFSRFNLETPWGSLTNLEIRLLGKFQIANAALAVSSALYLGVEENAIREGLIKAFIPGRFELVSRQPLVILDGAHNSAKMQALLSSVREIFPDKKIKILFTPKKTNETKQMLEVIFPFTEQVYLTSLKNIPIPKLLLESANYIKSRTGRSAEIFEDSTHAYEQISQSLDNGDLLLITGSFYLVGEIRDLLQKRRHLV